MLRRLFVTEFRNIIEYARKGISLSSDAAQQLYLGIYSIAVYLRSRPEILISLNWIRTRKLELGKPDKHLEIFRLFEDINIELLKYAKEEEKQRTSHWILFLLINILAHPQGDTQKNLWFQGSAAVPLEELSAKQIKANEEIRFLYKFITMGLGGFI